MLSFDEAQARLLDAARKVKGVDRVPLADGLGRVLAESIRSSLDVPPLDNSGMDGYAVRCADVPVAGTALRMAQRIPAGSVGHALEPGTAARIFTGAPVPAGADAVVMQELCERGGHGAEGMVIVNHVPARDDNIRRAGEDIRKDAEVLAAGTMLTPAAIGMAASVGVAQLPVLRRLSVAVLSTGDELATPGEPLPPGAIYNSNRYQLTALLKSMGCVVEDFGNLPDSLDATRAALRKAGALHDLVITSGGVSVGEEDHVKPALEAEGELSLWSIAVKPGKPLAFGRVGQADFVGLPGNPVSAFVTFSLLVRPFIRKCQGARELLPQGRTMIAGFEWAKPGNRREFLRVRIGADGRLERYANQSSGVLTSCVWADGLADIAAGMKVSPGDTLRYLAFAEMP
ncbi:MAG: molybdopterin molybdotransferase MoeA [Rhodocyclaceae bacterium]|jgi:molybdopterin molybdotransferase|nr:molybdopterin molybdotransferase MoeA [Rhodocyclaceae bacterium]MBK6553091.1 molybdopterin molybdotransferase MoeA [Rhodocyclaceae bacterium]MBK6675967.1 molybdopterin molybdotransferase MoeA [Rhodocyclaceae bacterium]MBK9311412.1 molybdopterin molybdotransferase MoeA [Rhodocyclaceae bacterium]MBK9956432.1 molybdopterin molybdotransferase MoeA [Rhodocyclaceae bacterium]